ncbi:winged helix-turn-helix transcriptional regulator [Rhodococcus sp. NCIMB 12038]
MAGAGLVTREVCEGPPVSVTYQLTEAGQSLMPVLDELADWARTHLRLQ